MKKIEVNRVETRKLRGVLLQGNVYLPVASLGERRSCCLQQGVGNIATNFNALEDLLQVGGAVPLYEGDSFTITL